MSLQGIKKEYIEKAFNYVDEYGCPSANESTRYFVVSNEKNYPPKYVIAVARHLQDNVSIDTSDYNAIEAKNYLTDLGYKIVEPTDAQVKYTLTITANEITSTDSEFSIDNLEQGNNFEAISVYFENAAGQKIDRQHAKREQRICNQTLPKLALQIFENKLAALNEQELKDFPICRYAPDKPLIKGIYSTVDEFITNYRNSQERFIYKGKARDFVVYTWNLFSTLLFAKECLIRFGNKDDKFVLVYRRKKDKENTLSSLAETKDLLEDVESSDYVKKYASMLKISKNVIFHGAPGTGKSYLAKEIASYIVSDGYTCDCDELNEEQKQQIGFVQFHPSYDYTDFVEGLRPITTDNGDVGFELQPGVFKKFVEAAIENKQGISLGDDVIEKFIFDAMENNTKFTMKKGDTFVIEDGDESKVMVKNTTTDTELKRLKINTIKKLLYSDKEFNNVTDIASFLGMSEHNSLWSYYFPVIEEFKKQHAEPLNKKLPQEKEKRYVFIIDEINRGEISKIFGELFFAIDPGYRGEKGGVLTQYANMHDDPNEKFYIPDNVYIIGTMNDIDRSVDSFDFAMRRRFRFINLKADECSEMLEAIKDESVRQEAFERMSSLNIEIAKTEELGESYQIGASYFLKLNELNNDYNQLWEDYLLPLLQDYVKGFSSADELINNFKTAYNIKTINTVNEDTNN